MVGPPCSRGQAAGCTCVTQFIYISMLPRLTTAACYPRCRLCDTNINRASQSCELAHTVARI